MAPPRDNQRSRVYNAEKSVYGLLDNCTRLDSRSVTLHGSKMYLPIEVKFGDLDGVQTYADKVLAMRQVQRAFPQTSLRPISVRQRMGHTRAHYEPAKATIAMPVPETGFSHTMREMYVLHEIAHHLALGFRHGPEFAGALHFLVEEVMGVELAFVLQDAYRVHGVDWTPVQTSV